MTNYTLPETCTLLKDGKRSSFRGLTKEWAPESLNYPLILRPAINKSNKDSTYLDDQLIVLKQYNLGLRGLPTNSYK